MTPQQMLDIADCVARSFRRPPDQTDDLRQEAVIGMVNEAHRLDESRSAGEQRSYLYRVGHRRALNYLAWSRRFREVAASSFTEDGDQTLGLEIAQSALERRTGVQCTESAEEYVAARHDCQIALELLESAQVVLSPQQAALLRYKLGFEEMRDDLVRLGPGPRGAVSNVARAKLYAHAKKKGLDDIITPSLLLRVFAREYK